MTAVTKNDALALLRKYKVGPRVMEHVLAVHDYAMEIADNIECDRDLVEAGSLLHDIGRAKTHGIEHAIIGAGMLRNEGVDERVVRIVERHVGAGLTAPEAKKLGLPPKDYVPETIEEKIVCHADNLIGGTERISIQDTISMARKKWFPGSVDRLISMHYQVFKPDIVILKDDAPEDVSALLKGFDVLYKIGRENGRYAVLLYGHDSKKAADYMVKKGIARRG
jgi:uncharacterized protein (TIGR00295 family)